MKREFLQLRGLDDRSDRRYWHIPTNDGCDVLCKSFTDPDIIVVRYTDQIPKPLCGCCARTVAGARLLADMARCNRQPNRPGILSKLLGRGKSPRLKIVSEITTIAITKE